MRRAIPIAVLLGLALAGCGSSDDDGGGDGSASTPAASSTAGAAPAGTEALTSCLEKGGLTVTGSGSELKASGNGDVVEIHLFSQPGQADAFAKQQSVDSTQAGNRVAVYGANPKPKTVNAVETCLPEE